MEDVIILYSSTGHLNSMLLLSKFITKHHPSTAVTVLSTAADPAAPSVTYRRLPDPTPPPKLTNNITELLFEIPRLNNRNLCDALEEISQKSRIKAVVIDFFCNGAFEVFRSLDIPTYFYVSCGMPMVCLLMHLSTIDETTNVDIVALNGVLDIPGVPKIKPPDLPRSMHFRQSNTYKHYVGVSKNIRKSAGVLANGFEELDFTAMEAIRRSAPPVYMIGPLVAESNGGAEHECIKWLDQQPDKTVIFLCFGRRGSFTAKQLKEIAVGLENSGHRFLWSVREKSAPENSSPDLDELLPEGFLERTKDRGFVIKTWAPQKEVLSHDSVGGFVTHCGRSSIMEAVSFGVPMIGWPIDAEQRLNRVVMVEEIKVALPLEEVEDGFVTAGELEKRVRELMDSVTGEGVRQRVSEMKYAAEAAVRENGSSVIALHNFIQSIKT